MASFLHCHLHQPRSNSPAPFAIMYSALKKRREKTFFATPFLDAIYSQSTKTVYSSAAWSCMDPPSTLHYIHHSSFPVFAPIITSPTSLFYYFPDHHNGTICSNTVLIHTSLDMLYLSLVPIRYGASLSCSNTGTRIFFSLSSGLFSTTKYNFYRSPVQDVIFPPTKSSNIWVLSFPNNRR